MLRRALAFLGATALIAIAACSKGGDPAPSDPATDPDGETSPSGTKKKSQKTNAPGSSGDPGTSSGDPGSSSGDPATAPGAASGISDKVDVSDVDITVGGQARRYVLAVPKSYDENKAYPLVIGLHGDGQNARGFLDESKLTLATGDQAIVAFPDQVVDLFTDYQDNTDQRLVSATINQLKSQRNIDPGKIWGFGYSKGAFMLNELGCRKPGLFTAIAPHAGGAPQEQDDDGNVDCPAAQALPVFATMGTNDDPEGGQFEADYWAGLAGCHGGTQQGTPAMCQAYENCDAPVVFCTVQGQSHFPLYPNAAADSWAWFNSL